MSEKVERLPAEYVMQKSADRWSDWRKIADLIRHLTRRQLAARYRGSTLGFFWSLLNPVLMMCIYTLVFKYIFRLSAPGVPYPVFFLTGLLAWSFLQTATMNGAASIVDNYSLINKAYFPRYVLPVASVLSNAFNYLVSLPILIAFCLLFGVRPSWTLLLLPLALLHLLALALGLSMIAAGLTPFFRDLVQLLEVVFVGWFFATPILYPASMAEQNLPPGMHRLYELNPMNGAISFVRTVFLNEPVRPQALAISVVGALIFLVVGTVLFNRLSRRFAALG